MNDATENPETDAACCDYRQLVSVFKALSDETRQRLLVLLGEEGEQRVNDLVARFGISQPTMSHHLGVLKNAGLVSDRRQGQSVYYAVNRVWLTECCSGFFDRFEKTE